MANSTTFFKWLRGTVALLKDGRTAMRTDTEWKHIEALTDVAIMKVDQWGTMLAALTHKGRVVVGFDTNDFVDVTSGIEDVTGDTLSIKDLFVNHHTLIVQMENCIVIINFAEDKTVTSMQRREFDSGIDSVVVGYGNGIVKTKDHRAFWFGGLAGFTCPYEMPIQSNCPIHEIVFDRVQDIKQMFCVADSALFLMCDGSAYSYQFDPDNAGSTPLTKIAIPEPITGVIISDEDVGGPVSIHYATSRGNCYCSPERYHHRKEDPFLLSCTRGGHLESAFYFEFSSAFNHDSSKICLSSITSIQGEIKAVVKAHKRRYVITDEGVWFFAKTGMFEESEFKDTFFDANPLATGLHVL